MLCDTSITFWLSGFLRIASITRNRISPPSRTGIGSRFRMPSEMLIMARSDRNDDSPAAAALPDIWAIITGPPSVLIERLKRQQFLERDEGEVDVLDGLVEAQPQGLEKSVLFEHQPHDRLDADDILPVRSRPG